MVLHYEKSKFYYYIYNIIDYIYIIWEVYELFLKNITQPESLKIMFN